MCIQSSCLTAELWNNLHIQLQLNAEIRFGENCRAEHYVAIKNDDAYQRLANDRSWTKSVECLYL